MINLEKASKKNVNNSNFIPINFYFVCGFINMFTLGVIFSVVTIAPFLTPIDSLSFPLYLITMLLLADLIYSLIWPLVDIVTLLLVLSTNFLTVLIIFLVIKYLIAFFTHNRDPIRTKIENFLNGNQK
jgi:hypothetical protein